MEQRPVERDETAYLSVSHGAVAEITIKRSKFICNLRRVGERAQFDSFIREITDLHPKANHHCWAYIIRNPSKQEHFSDAGEPSGTAGRPILGALKQHSLENSAAIVSRYYGGIKLGVKGLIDAYRNCAQLAVSSASLRAFSRHSLVKFSVPYDLYNSLLSIISKCNIPGKPANMEFAELISGEMPVPDSLLGTFRDKINEIMPSKSQYNIIISKTDDMELI
ncbi:MAG: YigZ family protein [Synergistaceae bacterium]|nr:YigZ family protein [Synergistaceae bacterium]